MLLDPDYPGTRRRPPEPALVLSYKNTTPERIALGINIMEAGGEGFRIPLMRAVRRGELAFSALGHPEQTPPLSKLDHTGLPSVLLVGDDDDLTRLGPGGWRYAARTLRWASGAVLHGTGGQPEHYVRAIAMARKVRRVALIETTSAQLDPWMALTLRFVPAERVLRIQPFPGGMHPTPLPRSALQ